MRLLLSWWNLFRERLGESESALRAASVASMRGVTISAVNTLADWQNLCSRRWIPRQGFRDLQEIQRFVDL
jgi:hypothetical protein